jgi:hypothetical protein
MEKKGGEEGRRQRWCAKNCPGMAGLKRPEALDVGVEAQAPTLK